MTAKYEQLGKKEIFLMKNCNFSKQKIFNGFYIAFVCVVVLITFIRIFISLNDYENWHTTEWMINYESGFVRRGLMGEILFLLTKSYNINLLLIIKIICVIVFFTMCAFFVYKFWDRGYVMYLLPTSFFLGMSSVSNCPFFRKDALMICCLIVAVWLFYRKMPIFVRFILINIVLSFMILSHEAFVFISLPVLFFLVAKNISDNQIAYIASFVFLLPSIVAFVATFAVHGNTEIAQNIWHSWQSIGIPLNDFPTINKPIGSSNSIAAIGWRTFDTVKFHLCEFNLRGIGCGIFCVFVAYYLSINSIKVFAKNSNYKETDRTFLSTILIFQFLCLTPMFTVLSCDFGRVVFYWIVSSFTIFLIVPLSFIKKIPIFILTKVQIINKFVDTIVPPTKMTVAIFLLFVGAPPCVSIDFFRTSIIGTFMFAMEKILIVWFL